MLSQKYRFHSRGGVNYTYQKGRALRTQSLTLIHNPNSRGYRRFAVVVSKKVLKSAVGRNRIRRRVYEAIRLENPRTLPPTDYIFVVHNQNYVNLPFSEIRTSVHDLLARSIPSKHPK